jgi:hypothetical protein
LRVSQRVLRRFAMGVQSAWRAGYAAGSAECRSPGHAPRAPRRSSDCGNRRPPSASANVERFGQAGVSGEQISLVKDTYTFISPAPPAHLIESFKRFYSPTMNAFEAAEKSGKVEDLHRQLLELAKAQNKAPGGGTSIPATFMRVTVCL